ncbi:hypothetical protein NLI96_g1616 [Meripilus lineatus]|uniref:Dienelactone hydrolase domain-containing protein n=1 Tax=Meripilus lineatus TaxID=2056292 RepID=A0AAD5VA98_9APHY|nr:hypothetical protein NLI96_g1616 [Physisporinus lineatus]
MSTATPIHNTNVACCTIPPVHSNYEPKGTFKSYGGFKKVYVTGPETLGQSAIVCVYDIFGFKPQTQQGADIIADNLKVQVLMPDFFEDGEPYPLENFPPKTDEDKAKLQAFFGGIALPPKNGERLLAFGKTLKDDGVKFLGVYGFCWGGKVTILAGSQSGSSYDAVSLVHPAMLSAADSENLAVPIALYPSKDEPESEFNKIVEIIKSKPIAAKSDFKIWDTFHGFAAARANLDDEDNNAKYKELYQSLIKFFKNAGDI